MFDILVINRNGLEYLDTFYNCLKSQTYSGKYNLTIVDNDSHELGTKQWLDVHKGEATIIENTYNRPVNHIWNEFVWESKQEYICILNNDIQFLPNFLSNIHHILNKGVGVHVGAVIHPTNHAEYTEEKELEYKLLPKFKYRKGWDICMRRDAYIPIDRRMLFYAGDDFIFEWIYRQE